MSYSKEVETAVADHLRKAFPNLFGKAISLDTTDEHKECADREVSVQTGGKVKVLSDKYSYALFALEINTEALKKLRYPFLLFNYRAASDSRVKKLVGDVLEKFKPKPFWISFGVTTSTSDVSVQFWDRNVLDQNVWDLSDVEEAKSKSELKTLDKMKYVVVLVAAKPTFTNLKMPAQLESEIDGLFSVITDKIEESMDPKLSKNILDILSKARKEIKNKYGTKASYNVMSFIKKALS